MPKVVKSDGGAQFRQCFTTWLGGLNIKHEVSSPYNPSSNGMSENGVKQVKGLMKKCRENKEDFDSALLHLNSSKRASGAASPSSIFYKRILRTSVPDLPGASFDIVQARKEREDDQVKMRRLGGGVKTRKGFEVGSKVLYREPRKGSSFKKRGVVTAIRKGGRSYVIETASGSSTIRNNKYMRLNTVDSGDPAGQQVSCDQSHLCHERSGGGKEVHRDQQVLEIPRRGPGHKEQVPAEGACPGGNR
jgi:hypothetical protein